MIRAWDTSGLVDGRGVQDRKRILVFPAMNTAMWVHPVTEMQIAVVEGWDWFEVFRPVGVGSSSSSSSPSLFFFSLGWLWRFIRFYIDG